MFVLLDAGVPPSLQKGFLSPHSPADRATPAVAKPVSQGARQKLRICWQPSDKGAWRAHPIPALLTHVQEEAIMKSCLEEQGGYQKTPRATLPGTHTQPFKIPFPLFSCLPVPPTNCHAQAWKKRRCRSPSSVWLVVTPWSVGCQVPPSIGILQARTLSVHKKLSKIAP